VRVRVTDTVVHKHRQARLGRPGPDTVYRRIEHHRFNLEVSTDAYAVAFDAASDGCFPLIANEDTAPAELLRVYKVQPHLERRHATFKGVIRVPPVMLKSDSRINALEFFLYAALLVLALVERELRLAMGAKGIESLPLSYEERPCEAPTAARVFELLESLATTIIRHDGEALTAIAPSLNPLQRQLLSLLKVPHRAYGPAMRPLRKSG
jgi:transposase